MKLFWTGHLSRAQDALLLLSEGGRALVPAALASALRAVFATGAAPVPPVLTKNWFRNQICVVVNSLSLPLSSSSPDKKTGFDFCLVQLNFATESVILVSIS